MLYRGRAIQPGAKGAEAAGASYRSWWLRSSLSILAVGAGGSLLVAILTWIALRLGATAVLPTLIGTQAPVGASPLSEIAAGWTLSFFSSQLVPVQIWAASPPGLGFGLGSPLLLALLIVASFRAGLRLESVSSGGFNSLAASGRASAVAVPQALLVVALLALAHAGSGPLAGAPLPVATVLPVLLVGGAAAAGAAWRRERRLGRSTAAGVRGLGLAGIALALGSTLAGILVVFVLVAGIITGQVRVDGGLGTLLLGLIYLPNGAVLAAAAGLGGGPPLDGALEAGFCGLVTAGCFAVALHVRRRADRLEQIFFAVGFPILLLIGAVASRPLVSDHTLGFTLGVAFWVGAVISSMAAAAGPFLAELALGSRLAVGRPLGLIADWLPPVPEVDPAPVSALRAVPDRSHHLGRVVLALTAIVMAGLITLVIVVPAPELATTPEGTIADYLRLEAAGLYLRLVTR